MSGQLACREMENYSAEQLKEKTLNAGEQMTTWRNVILTKQPTEKEKIPKTIRNHA